MLSQDEQYSRCAVSVAGMSPEPLSKHRSHPPGTRHPALGEKWSGKVTVAVHGYLAGCMKEGIPVQLCIP